MQIQNCPILRPTWKQFQDFREYVEHLDRTYKKQYGMVKIIPPAQWKPRTTNIELSLKNLIISSPIEQNVYGKGGIYQCLHIPKKSLTFEEYRARSQQLDKITDKLTADEVQSMFWKNIVFSPPLYGADLLNTLMEESAGSWNLNNLDSVLQDSMDHKVKGVNTPYCYVGCWKALFCWHTQDLELSAINYMHCGKSKFWYALHYDDRSYLQKQANKLFPQHFSNCSQFLRHKTTLINPYYLKKKYPEIRLTKTQHKSNQFVLVFGGCYHTGFNFGFNIAQAVNYGTIDWLDKVVKAKSCKCSKSSVKASLAQIRKNLQKSSIKNTKQFKIFQENVPNQIEEQQKQKQNQSEDQLGPSRHQIKSALSKQIKKLKKAPKKVYYKNQEYEIENWGQCDKCGKWRIVKTPLSKNAKFLCKNIGKKCNKQQKISKNIVTI